MKSQMSFGCGPLGCNGSFYTDNCEHKEKQGMDEAEETGRSAVKWDTFPLDI